MIVVLDTNVLSELLRPSPAPCVMKWIARQDSQQIFTTTITQAEILSGVELLPAGKRKSALMEAVDLLFSQDFKGRLLAFDEKAARNFAVIFALRRANGNPIAQLDAMIAAICRREHAVIATRDSKGFRDCDLHIVNPWQTHSN